MILTDSISVLLMKRRRVVGEMSTLGLTAEQNRRHARLRLAPIPHDTLMLTPFPRLNYAGVTSMTVHDLLTSI